VESTKKLTDWVRATLNSESIELVSLSGDASFRRYFRLNALSNENSELPPMLAIDSPPEQINNQGFITISKLFTQYDVKAPQILYQDTKEGFFLIEDFGDKLLLNLLSKQSEADSLYKEAIDSLLKIQLLPSVDWTFIPSFDAQFLQFEMNLFRDWFIDKHLRLELDADEHQIIENTFDKLTLSALEQPQTFVHRDYHSRNLMKADSNELVVIDFQDAVKGPVSYDLVSLLKDCYIQWPESKVKEWAHYYWDEAIKQGILATDFEAFFKQFEWMGMQRHIKVLGIFCRLNYRDEKPQYLNDLPLTMDYLLKAAGNYVEFEDFSQLLHKRICPALKS